MTVTTRHAPAVRLAINPWVIALTVTLATFMELLDTSIANVALPHIGGGLGRSYDEVTWVLTTYLVANAVILPMSAWLSRALGRKTYYLICVALFTAMSLFCGLAPSLELMLVGRVLQGIAGGGLAPVAQAILIDTFPPEKRASAFALYTVVLVTAPAVGPVLGGWITDNYSWRWIFFINVPIGLIALLLSSKLLQDPPSFVAERASVRMGGRLSVDGIGITLIVLSSAALEIALDRGQIEDWFGSAFICWLLGIAVVGWVSTVAWELNSRYPVIDFRMLQNGNFAIASILFFVFGIGLFGTTVLVPQILQSLYGYKATDAGLVLGPGALVITVLAPASAQLIQRRLVQPRTMVAFSLSTVAAAMWYFSTLTLDTNGGRYAWGRVFQGVGYGFFFVPVNMIAYSMLRPDQNNKASSLTNLFRNWGGSFGIAMISTVSERRQNFHQLRVSSDLAPASQSLQQSIAVVSDYLMQKGLPSADAFSAANDVVYRQLLRQSSFLAFMDCFRFIGVLTIAIVPLLFVVRAVRANVKVPDGH
jgi:DHA2 family multidrug resistance protein